MRFGCNGCLRNALYRWGWGAIQPDPKAHTHYQTLRRCGHSRSRARAASLTFSRCSSPCSGPAPATTRTAARSSRPPSQKERIHKGWGVWRAHSPGGLTEAKGAIRSTALRTGMCWTGRGLVGPPARGRRLPPYGLIRRTGLTAAEACRAVCTPKAAPATAGSTSRATHLDRVTWRTGRPRLEAQVPAP